MFKQWYYQRHKDSQNLIMTYPKWQNKPDLIQDFGCLLIAYLNAYNKKNNRNMSVRELNDLVIKNKGYNYLKWFDFYNGDLDKTKKACLNTESFLIPEVINKILDITEVKRNYNEIIDIKHPLHYYIIRTKYNDTGHYSLITSKTLKYFDSYDGVYKTPYVKDILEVIRITFKA